MGSELSGREAVAQMAQTAVWEGGKAVLCSQTDLSLSSVSAKKPGFHIFGMGL